MLAVKLRFFIPRIRALQVLTLLKELNADYELHVINMTANAQREPDYLGINPMGKVPAVKHGEALVTEQVAIYLYLADLYPEAHLAPVIGDPLRGPYLRWMVFYGSCFEPAIVDRSQKREPAPLATSPYGDFDTMLGTLIEQLSKGEYFLEDNFTALDVLWGTALTWTTMFKLVPTLPVIQAYIERFNARPSVKWVREKDAELVAAI
jgi:glutathione S-transferase